MLYVFVSSWLFVLHAWPFWLTFWTGKLQLSSAWNAIYVWYLELSGAFVKSLLVVGIGLLNAPLQLFLVYYALLSCLLAAPSLPVYILVFHVLLSTYFLKREKVGDGRGFIIYYLLDGI